MDENKKIKQLIDKVLQGTSSREEERFVQNYFEKNGLYEKWDPTTMGRKEEIQQNLKVKITYALYKSKNKQSDANKFRRLVKIAAAMLVVCLGAWYFQHVTKEKIASSLVSHEHIRPGSTKGLLTLTNGFKIDVEKIEIGKSIQQNGMKISRVTHDELDYTDLGSTDRYGFPALKNKLNILKTPLGGRLSIILSDGSKVWLNSGSELQFSNAFNSNTREVKIKGEAYFQVAKNEDKPFLVHTKGSEIKVLGTEFNVKSYDDDIEHEITLVEGSIQLQAFKSNKELRPGQKARINQKSNEMKIMEADVEAVTAYKYDNFIFKNQNIKDIMKEISRWYDVDVEYIGDINDKYFDVYISKNKNIQEILSIIELTESVHFKIDGRRVKVIG